MKATGHEDEVTLKSQAHHNKVRPALSNGSFGAPFQKILHAMKPEAAVDSRRGR